MAHTFDERRIVHLQQTKVGSRNLERVHRAAIRLSDGAVYTGQTHGDAHDSADAAHKRIAKSKYRSLFEAAEDGFMTTTGRFVLRDEAYRLAVKCGQLTPESYTGAVEDLWGTGVTAGGELCALAFTSARVP